jgi:hypothetical protein
MIPTGPRTKSQELAAQLPTMPAPRDPRVEPPSLAPAPPTAIEAELRAFVSTSVAPKGEQLAALEEVVRSLKSELARSSQADLEADAKLSAHELRIQRIESGVQSAAGSSAKVEKFLSGFLPPKAVGAIIAAMGVIQIVIQIVQMLRGH